MASVLPPCEQSAHHLRLQPGNLTAEKALSRGRNQGSARPPAAPPRAAAPTPRPRLRRAEGRGGPGRRAPPPGTRPGAPASPAVPPRPAAPPPPRALRSRDVRAAGPGTRWGAGWRAETDPGSVRAGSEEPAAWSPPPPRLGSAASPASALPSAPRRPPSSLRGDR